jgi:CRP-like cAMP-binding protein
VFLRQLVIHLKEKHFYIGSKIVETNDIINYVYIVFEGKACVVNSLGTKKRPLDKAR